MNIREHIGRASSAPPITLGPPAAEQFRDAMLRQIGAAPREIIADGKYHRFATGDKGRDDNGFYRFFDDDFPAGTFGDWKTGLKVKWVSDRASTMTPADREKIDRERAERAAEQEAEHLAKAERVREKWARLRPANPGHPYLTAKNICAYDLRQDGDRLVIPVTILGELWSLQYIAPNGEKRFETGARVAGGHCWIGEPAQQFGIVEGYATGASINEATGLPVVVAFNAGNLETVAKAIRAQHPDATIFIAADDDHATELRTANNPGLSAANETARAIGATVIAPDFDRVKHPKASDWNDYARLHGDAELKRAFVAKLSNPAPVQEPQQSPAAQEINEKIIVAEPLLPPEPRDLPPPPGEPVPNHKGPAPDRSALRVSAWLKREIPPRDFLLGEVLCTTSRWLLIGETGVGKTLFALELAAAIATGSPFLGWSGRRPARVLYLDGELPAETVKERLQLLEPRYGSDLDLWVLSRDVLHDDDMPPLNTPEGRTWLLREIDALKPDVVILDSIMCLLAGAMSEEESWAPVKELLPQISARRCAQIWLHHTGHNTAHGFGTKTREFYMDTVLMLSKLAEEDAESTGASFQFEFQKSRLKTPKNHEQFKAKTVRCEEQGFVFEEGKAKASKGNNDSASMRKAFVDAYARLIDNTPTSAGFDGKPVRKVRVEDIRDEMRSRGYLETDEKGHLLSRSRMAFSRTKADLFTTGKFVEKDGMVWRIRP